MKKVLSALILSTTLASAGPAVAQSNQQSEAPNIVLILVDDASFTDLGAFGGEAQTPNIDAIAEQGMIFSNFHASPLCAPSRAMLLTGLDNHLTGMATIPEIMPEEHLGQPGYTGNLQPGVTTVAERLDDAGYRTYMTGKWHLGHGEGDLPNSHGFDHSFVLDAFGGDHYTERPHSPIFESTQWYEDGEPTSIPDDFYSSEDLVDKMIAYIDQEAGSNDPFFAYVGFLAVQRPIQVPPEFTEKYIDTYQDGWETLHHERWKRAQSLGLIPQNAPLAEFPKTLRAWDDLTAAEQTFAVKKMASYAGMLEAMDYHFGRLISHLKETGEYANTIFIIASDNGPEGGANWDSGLYRTWASLTGYTYNFETMGERGSYNEIGPEWAIASASPTSLFKSYASEGGIRVPLIITGPGIEAGAMTDAISFITDITPTMLDLAGVSYKPQEMTGRSLRPLLHGELAEIYGEDDVIGMEVSGNAALYKGNWKITRNQPPWGDAEWRLYNISADPGETYDLTLTHPDIYQDLVGEYDAYAAEVGVLDLPEGYSAAAVGAGRAIQTLLQIYWWFFALVIGGVVILLFGLYRWALRPLFRSLLKTAN
ncbi:MAG: arylsulfatase [Chloroflexota bacterium]